MKLKSEIVGDEGSATRSAALVYDDDLPEPQIVAIVLYSSGGNVIIWFQDGYDPLEIIVQGEKFMGQSLQAGRFKEYRATVKS